MSNDEDISNSYKMIELSVTCVRKDKQGGWVDGGSSRLVHSITHEILTQFILLTAILPLWGITKVCESQISNHCGFCICPSSCYTREYGITTLSTSIKISDSCSRDQQGGGKIGGDDATQLMSINSVLNLIDGKYGIILLSQTSEFWKVCIQLKNIEQGGETGRSSSRLYIPFLDSDFIVNKQGDCQKSLWKSDKEILLVLRYQYYISHAKTGICTIWLSKLSLFTVTLLIEIKRFDWFNISSNHHQSTLLICIKILPTLEISLKEGMRYMSLEFASASLNRHPHHKLTHYLMLPRHNLAFLSLCLFITIITIHMATNQPQNSPAAHTQPEQGRINPDLLDCCLVGRLLSNKPIRFIATRNRLASLWQPDKQMDTILTETNRMLFQFYDQGEMERVLQTGPWHFDNYPVLIKKLPFGGNPNTMPLDTMDIWIQVHNLPFGFMTESMGHLLGNHIGRLLKYDFNNNYGTWRKYMRLRVAMNIMEPLRPSWEFEREDAEPVTVVFKYEKLGNFCYICGMLGHTDGYCSKRFEKEFMEGQKKWGPSLKAEFQGPQEGGAFANPWLRRHDAGRRPEIPTRNNIHSRVGRVRIGRNSNTKELTFAQQVGNQSSSTEWAPFDPLSKEFNAEQVRPPTDAFSGTTVPQLTETGETSAASGLDEGDEARIARLVKEARLKNLVPTMAGPDFVVTDDQTISCSNLLQPLLQNCQTVRQSNLLFLYFYFFE